MQSLGIKATYDVTFTAAYGDGAENCFTLSLGYWAGSQAERFNRENLKLVLGISKRVLRGVLVKKFRSACKAHGFHEEAVVQNFQHRKDVQDAVCMSGLRNEVNSMAQSLHGWG